MNIGEVSKLTQLSAKKIRDYEKAGFITPQRTLADYRTFGEKDVQDLCFIRNARNVGFSLKQIKTLLDLKNDKNRCSRDVKALTTVHIQDLQQKIVELQNMLALLQSWHNDCRGDEQSHCPILDNLHD